MSSQNPSDPSDAESAPPSTALSTSPAPGSDRPTGVGRVAELDDEAILAKHDALTAIDHVIGLEATVARLEADLKRTRGKLKALREQVAARDKEIAEMRASRSWRVGRALVSPVRRLRG